jgi:exodeoxyribonuclease-3
VTRLRIASVNVNGVRAAFRKGMGDWLAGRDVDILAMQEVRAETSHLDELLGDEWDILHDPATAKGRAGVAIASRRKADIHRVTFGPDDFDSAGRWLEADYDIDGTVVTVVSCYVPSGIADTPKQDQKWVFLEGMLHHVAAVKAHNPLSVVVGDFNIGHRTLDIRNWKGNVKKSGFLPRERAYLDEIFGAEDDPATTRAPGSASSTSGGASRGRSTARTPGGRRWAGRSTTTRGGASTTRRRPSSWPLKSWM